MEKLLENLLDAFNRHFGSNETTPQLYFAPGRVNLIGEHTDYNGGYVFPCALTFGTYVAVRKVPAKVVRMASMNFEGGCEVPLFPPPEKNIRTWCNYPLGVIVQFLDRGIPVNGLEMMFMGDVPQGAGLSSSASIEMATAIAINDMFQAGLSPVELAKLSQKAENDFVGMNCGIMDQFTSALGKKDHSIFLNCRTLNFSQVPLVMPDHALVITNTNKTRGLLDSKYNERRSECESAVGFLSQSLDIECLGQVSTEQFEKYQSLIPDPVIRKRAKHVISENQRVLEAVKALHNNELEEFGRLMVASHQSLRDDYEVSCPELDILAEEACRIPGTLGSRMTGAGFGGCTVSIVLKKAIPQFCEQLGHIYQIKSGLSAGFYVANSADGARKITP